MKLKIFIGWSGDLSKTLALALKAWLEKFFDPHVEILISLTLMSGGVWTSDLLKKLRRAQFGIMVMTPENISSPWIHFESGIIIGSGETRRVCPFLFRLRPEELPGTLQLLTARLADEEGTRQLVVTINDALKGNRRQRSILEDHFRIYWPELEEKLHNIPNSPPQPLTPQEQHIETLEANRKSLQSKLAPLQANFIAVTDVIYIAIKEPMKPAVVGQIVNAMQAAVTKKLGEMMNDLQAPEDKGAPTNGGDDKSIAASETPIKVPAVLPLPSTPPQFAPIVDQIKTPPSAPGEPPTP